MELENRLIGAILIQAVKDWQRTGYKDDVHEFLQSRWFDELSEALELDKEVLRDKLLSGQVQGGSIRAAYRKNTASYLQKEQA